MDRLQGANMAKNRSVEHFFQHWARSSLHLLSFSACESEKRPNPCEDKMPAVFFFLDSLAHHYMNSRRTPALCEAVNFLKGYCSDYPRVTKERSRKALFLVRYLYKALGLERNFAFAEAEENNPSAIITERRAAERHPLIAVVRFRVKGTEDWTASRIVNISENGLKLETVHMLDRGDFLELEIIPDAAIPFLVDVETVWTASSPTRPGRQYGLQLAAETSASAKDNISTLIYERSVKERLLL